MLLLHCYKKGLITMRVILIFCCVFMAMIPPVSAGFEDIKKNISQMEIDAWKKMHPRFDKQYNNILEGMYKDPRKIKTQVALLRSYYPRTSHYSPFSKTVLNKMTKYAQIIDTSSDNLVINDALFKYKRLLNRHLMNFDVASFAVTMSSVDVRFGDEMFYTKIRNALINRFYKKGVGLGLRPEIAYHIISYGEETYILDQIGGRIDKSEIYEVGNNKIYNVHDITIGDGDYQQLFMDISTPIRNVFFNQIIKARENSIPQISQ